MERLLVVLPPAEHPFIFPGIIRMEAQHGMRIEIPSLFRTGQLGNQEQELPYTLTGTHTPRGIPLATVTITEITYQNVSIFRVILALSMYALEKSASDQERLDPQRFVPIVAIGGGGGLE